MTDGPQPGPPRELCCPITEDLYKDPVVLVETGQTYERKSIEQWFSRGHKIDPLTGKQLTSIQLVPNYAIKGLVQSWIDRRGQNGSQAPDAEAVSPQHTKYPSVFDGSPQDKIAQAADVLQHLRSPSMEVAAYRNGCTYHLFQLISLAKDEACRDFLLNEGAVKLMVPLLADEKLAEGSARLLCRLSNPISSKSLSDAGGWQHLNSVLPHAINPCYDYMQSTRFALLSYMNGVESHIIQRRE